MMHVASNITVSPAGGGVYSLPQLSVGIFLNDQPTHRFSHGSSSVKHLPLKKNQGWILPAGSEGLCEYDDDLEFAFISLDERILDEFGVSRGFEFEAIVGELDPLLVSLSLNAGSFIGGDSLYRETMLRALAAQIVQSVRPMPAWQSGVEDRRLRRVLDFIHDNLAEDISLAAMSDMAAMSATTFSKAFRRELGASPLQYVIGARLELASVLLRTTRLSVAEIAWRCGYKDLSRFGQHFKRKFGGTPAAFRAS